MIAADLWKLGQLKAGDQLRFVAVSHSDAVRLEAQQLHQLSRLNGAEVSPQAPGRSHPIAQPHSANWPVRPRRLRLPPSGRPLLLVELGPLELDIARRFRVHALMLWLERNRLAGLMELTPACAPADSLQQPALAPYPAAHPFAPGRSRTHPRRPQPPALAQGIPAD